MIERIRSVARLRAELPTWAELARESGLSEAMVRRIANGYQYKHELEDT